jgi:predicted ester cyclase
MKSIITIFALAVFFAGCMPGENKTENQIAKNKAASQAFADEVINKHNPAMVDSLCTADYVEHSTDPTMKPGREGLKKSMTELISGYPDVHVTTNFVVADSNTVVSHYTMTGTNTGPMMGMPPTNKKMNVDGVSIVKFKDGKRAEHWLFMEEMKLMQQMGMMPDMSQMMAAGDKQDSSKIKMNDKKITKK